MLLKKFSEFPILILKKLRISIEWALKAQLNHYKIKVT